MDGVNEDVITSIADLARQAVEPHIAEAVHFAVIPQGSKIESLEKLQYPHGIPPARIVAWPKFQDAGSFCSYINTFKDDKTRLFADAERLTFTAMIDYHAAGERKPEFVCHRASLALKHSTEWKLWIDLNEKHIPQKVFVEFIEDNRADIVKPDPARMLEVARDFESHSDVNFQSKVDSRSGTAVLKYEEVVNAKVSNGSIEVPENFTIRIPVFYGEAPIEITARLRFRINDGDLKFEYHLYRPAEVIAKAFDVAVAGIAADTTLEVLLGNL